MDLAPKMIYFYLFYFECVSFGLLLLYLKTPYSREGFTQDT